jgi:UDP-N-acetyl-D-galactosamine dehydrogenase
MTTVAVIGLGYVGLPRVVEFGKQLRTIGFDISASKVESCQRGVDPSRELSDQDLSAARHAVYTTDGSLLSEADIIIVAVPTPVDLAHIPDFKPLIGASKTVGQHMKKGAIVVYESTVYPGATEEVCIPILELSSGLKWKREFFVGYSPERINPGDKDHTLTKILKIVSGDSPETLAQVAQLYEKIIVPGVHRASSIKAAEAAKVIENTQRDLNIALMNELAIIFDRLGLDTSEVLEAAGTKWNFLKFKPGLVGGHCIGVDPYYLTHKAEMLGYHPQVILAGRRINDSMGKFIAEQTIKQMIASGSHIKGAKVNVLGLTFKENCGDLRNSKVIDIINELKTYGVDVSVTDPQADADEAMHEYGVRLLQWDDLPRADAMVVAVAHQEYADFGTAKLSEKLVNGGAFIDVKAVFDATALRSKGYRVWRL